jgi:hypothetical protein
MADDIDNNDETQPILRRGARPNMATLPDDEAPSKPLIDTESAIADAIAHLGATADDTIEDVAAPGASASNVIDIDAMRRTVALEKRTATAAPSVDDVTASASSGNAQPGHEAVSEDYSMPEGDGTQQDVDPTITEVTPKSIMDEAELEIRQLEAQKGADMIANMIIARRQDFILKSAKAAAARISDIQQKEALLRQGMTSPQSGGGGGAAGFFGIMANRIFNGNSAAQRAQDELKNFIDQKRAIKKEMRVKRDPVYKAMSRIQQNRENAAKSFELVRQELSDSNSALYETTTGQAIRGMIERKSVALGLSPEQVAEEIAGWKPTRHQADIEELRSEIKAKVLDSTHPSAVAAIEASKIAKNNMKRGRQYLDDVVDDMKFLADNGIELAPAGSKDAEKIQEWFHAPIEQLRGVIDPVDPTAVAKERESAMKALNDLFESLKRIFARLVSRGGPASDAVAEQLEPSPF